MNITSNYTAIIKKHVSNVIDSSLYRNYSIKIIFENKKKVYENLNVDSHKSKLEFNISLY